MWRTSPGTATRSVELILCAALMAGCRGDERAEFPPMEEHGANLAIGPALRRVVAGAADDRLDISSIGEAVTDGATFLVTDFMGNRVLRVDTTFALISAFGTEGAGPGELMRPSMAVPWNDELVVGEFMNGRFTIFDRDGSYRRTVPGAVRPDFHGVRGDGTIVMQSSSPDHYALLLSPDGSSSPFAPRPAPLITALDARNLGGDGSLVLVGAGDTTHVFDNEWGVLLKYDPGGRLVLGRSLPRDVLDAVREYRDGFVEAFAKQGRRVVGLSLLHTMSFTDEGGILIRIGYGSTAALLVEPSDYSARRIVGLMSDPGLTLVAHASSALIVGSTYYTFADEGLAAYLLTPIPQ